MLVLVDRWPARTSKVCSRANMRMMKKFNESRVLLAGEAAHPIAGQELNSGVHDAVSFVRRHDENLRSSRKDSPMNLSSRNAVISKMLRSTTSLPNHALSPGLGHASMRRNPLIFMLGVNYRFSDIVLGEFAI
ncbi:hypothetical protein EDD22DRAFT_845248 [Suillus occidentalis]|nr:hypothetical protein EDD22DRAFT_845248 [Suillus occidentalis]